MDIVDIITRVQESQGIERRKDEVEEEQRDRKRVATADSRDRPS
jgi:hypothetical protein